MREGREKRRWEGRKKASQPTYLPTYLPLAMGGRVMGVNLAAIWISPATSPSFSNSNQEGSSTL